MSPTISDLDDDSLLFIFAHLSPFDKLRTIGAVCRRWRDIADQYNLFHDQTSFGTVMNVSCFDRKHHVFAKDVIDRLLFGPADQSTTNRIFYKGKFSLNDRILEQLLSKCPELRSLSLKFCKAISSKSVGLIGQRCCKLEHLDLSASLFDIDGGNQQEKILPVIGDQMTQLVHLNLLGCEPVTEDDLGQLLSKLNRLQHFVFGRHGEGSHVTGRFLSQFASDVKVVSIYGIDELAEDGMGAITSLSTGRGSSTEHLKLKGQLSVDLIRKVVEKFPLLLSLYCGDFFRDQWIDGTHTAIGAAIANLSLLESISFELPELIQFDGNIMEIMRGCTRLRSFKMQGGPIGNTTVELLCKWCPYLEELSLSYTSNFPSIPIRPTGLGLESLVNLSQLKYLTLNGTHLTDQSFAIVICGCNQLSIVDIRESPEITNEALNAVYEAAMSRPSQLLQLYVQGTQIDYKITEDDILMPSNLRLLYAPRQEDQFDEDIEFEGEEFEYGNDDMGPDYAENQRIFPPDSGLVFSDAYMYNQTEDCIRYCLEDLEI